LESAVELLETTKMNKEMQLELYGSLESARCFQLYANSDAQGAIEVARNALKLLPVSCFSERGYALIILGGALQMTGDIQLARETIYAELSAARDSGNDDTIYISRVLLALCFVHWMQADLSALDVAVDEARLVVGSGPLTETMTVAAVFKATALYHQNELTAVHDCLHGVLMSHAVLSVEYHAQCLIIASLTHHALGNASAAKDVARTLREFALNTRNALLVTMCDAFAAEVALRQDRVAEALNWAKQFDPGPFTPMYAFYSPVMTLAKVLVLEDSEESRERAGVLLKKLVDYLTRIHNRRFLIEALALRAMLLSATGDDDASTADLTKSVAMAQPGRFIRIFVDLGPRIGNLLNRLDLDEESLTYVGEILAALRQGTGESNADIALAPNTGINVGVEPLSKRELQILTLLAERLSNKEIADKLYISATTVKRHTANIYEKLGVHGRRQAVAKAAGLGLFSSPK